MNRDERRKAAKQARRSKKAPSLYDRAMQRVGQLDVGFRLLDSARPFDEGDTTDQHLKTRAAFERLTTGAADVGDFDRVAMAINLAKVRALDIDAGLADMLERAQNAMTAMRARHGRTGRLGFDGPGLVAVTEAMDAHEAITDASSPLQMRLAIQKVHRSIMKNINQKRTSPC